MDAGRVYDARMVRFIDIGGSMNRTPTKCEPTHSHSTHLWYTNNVMLQGTLQ